MPRSLSRSVYRRARPYAWTDESSNDILDDVAFHVRQTDVAAGVSVGELFVVASQQKYRRFLEVIDTIRNALNGVEERAGASRFQQRLA